MLNMRKKNLATGVFLLFLAVLLAIVGVFGQRVYAGSLITPMEHGQVLKLAEDYTFGKIYDRNGELIVQGTASGQIEWQKEWSERVFGDILNVSLDASFDRTKVCANAPVLYGAEDDRISLYSLLHPGENRTGGSVKLTLDANLQNYIYDWIGKSGYEHAYVLVSNYQTGEILAVYGEVFKDTLHPGSVIKPFLAAAALEVQPELIDFTYTCSKRNHNFATHDGQMVRINCYGNACHGAMDFSSAMAYSCNGYFVSLLQQIDKNEMQKVLGRMGFDRVISHSQLMYWDHSFIKESDDGIDYLQAAIGQSQCYMTVAGVNFCTNAVFNGGV